MKRPAEGKYVSTVVFVFGLCDMGVKVTQELSSCGRVSGKNCLAEVTNMRVHGHVRHHGSSRQVQEASISHRHLK